MHVARCTQWIPAQHPPSRYCFIVDVSPQKRAKANLGQASTQPGPPATRSRPVRFASEKIIQRTAPGDTSYRSRTNVGSVGSLTPVLEESDNEESEQSSNSSSSSSSAENEEGLRPDSSNNYTAEEDGGSGRELEASLSNYDDLDPVATCRKHFTSAWVYFPHVELLFLFFAFGGAVASQAAALRASCPEIFVPAGLALVRLHAPPRSLRCP